MYYFASDMHLGLLPAQESREREKLLIGWLRRVAADAEAIFLVGDLFDFWYEYRRVVPKGFTRLLGTLSELTDRGVEIHFFTGNHDMGNGVVTLQTQLAANVLGLPMEHIAVVQADTDATMMHFGDFASRGAFVCGQAAQKCAELLAARLKGYSLQSARA